MKAILHYPFSILVILAIAYLSFFKPPSTKLDGIQGIDKIVHVCMYLGLSGMLWLEFLHNHVKNHAPLWHAWVGACLLPLLYGGIVEILQETLTDNRSGDWIDFLADAIGVSLAALFAYYVLRPRMWRK